MASTTNDLPVGARQLTQAGAFRRPFVYWAAATFDWPGFSEAELFAANKVLNESDFEPLEDLHALMVDLKIGRHIRKRFSLTKTGRTLFRNPGRLFGIVTPYYLFEMDHLRFARTAERVPGNWKIFLNLLNVEAEDGTTGPEVGRLLLGKGISEPALQRFTSVFYVQVLRPLCWTGLLAEARPIRSDTPLFTKTPLWRAALFLNTDGEVQPALRH